MFKVLRLKSEAVQNDKIERTNDNVNINVNSCYALEFPEKHKRK